MAQKLYLLFRESTIISGTLAVGVVGTVCYLALTGQPIPDTLTGMGLSVIAFFFGSRAGQQLERIKNLIRSQERKERDYNEWLQSH